MIKEYEPYRQLLDITYKHYLPLLRSEEGDRVLLYDPVDKKVIGAHYGETHLGAAFIIGGMLFDRDEVVQKGIEIIKGFIAHSGEFQKSQAYHWDFNNFALCVLYEFLINNNSLSVLSGMLKGFILKQKDSNNATVNWHPMRLYVNSLKYKWTNDARYLNVIKKCREVISSAQYKDGFFEDLLPKGTSFNFQYHVYTTASIAFLNRHIGEKTGDLNAAISRVEDIIDSEGDLNYLGRGTNQIFAWGPAIYLLSLLEDKSSYDKALSFINDRGLRAVEKDNLILNEYDGEDKIWWWDYHYSSVYIAHYLFWMMLTAYEKNSLDYSYNKTAESDSGVHIHNEKNYVVIFDGRRHYLAESGKVIADICDSNGRALFKGAFGPYYKEYGYKYSIPQNTVHNFIGALRQKNIFGRFTEKPIYPESIDAETDNDRMVVTISYSSALKDIVVNLPWFDKVPPTVLDEQGNSIRLTNTGQFAGPYGSTNLFQSKAVTVSKLKLVIGDN